MVVWIMRVIQAAGYPAVALFMFIENVLPPIPSELIMPLAGYMALKGQLSFVGVIVAGTVGSAAGALPLYYAGRRVGEERLKRLAERHGRWLTVSPREIEQAQRWFDRHGGAAILFCHFVPGVRSLISLPAGIDKMHPAVFLIWTAAGAGLWAGLLAALGYYLGGNFGKIEEYLDPLSWIVLGAAALAYVVRVVRHNGRPRSELNQTTRD